MRKLIVTPVSKTFGKNLPATLEIPGEISVTDLELIISYNSSLEGKSIVIEGMNGAIKLFSENVTLARGKKSQTFVPNISLQSYITEIIVKGLTPGKFPVRLSVISNTQLSPEAENIRNRIEGVVTSTRNNLNEWSIGFSTSYNCFSHGNFGYMQNAPIELIEEVIEYYTINLDLKNNKMRSAGGNKMLHIKSYYIYVEHNRH